MTKSNVSPFQLPGALAVFLPIWFVVAFGVGASGSLARLPVPPPAIAVGLTVILALAIWRIPKIQAVVGNTGIGWMVAFHLVRIAAGGHFLVLYSRGVLPAEFALPAGWGDIAVGIAALPVLWFCLALQTSRQRNGLMLWNVFGLLDILLVLGNGIRLFLRDASLAEPFTTLPLALLPTMVVPIVIVTHLLIFFRLKGIR
ncbi:MAG: hypothetical protein ACK4UN_09570 [Limisphaerales bacterium]